MPKGKEDKSPKDASPKDKSPKEKEIEVKISKGQVVITGNEEALNAFVDSHLGEFDKHYQDQSFKESLFTKRRG